VDGLNTVNKYLLYIPEDYGEEPLKRWPLILYIHGAGTRSETTVKLKQTGIPNRIVKGAESTRDFVVLSPQIPTGKWPKTSDMMALLNSVCSDLNIDDNRLYITGQSMGGITTLDTLIAYPKTFAAAAPVAARTTNTSNLDKIDHIPIWFFHGDRDQTVSYDLGVENYLSLLNLGASEVQFTVYPGIAHNSWDLTYQREDLYRWLVQHERPGTNPGPEILMDQPYFGEGVVMEEDARPLRWVSRHEIDTLSIHSMRLKVNGVEVKHTSGNTLVLESGFSHLPPGHYSYRISALDDAGRENWIEDEFFVQSTQGISPDIQITSSAFGETYYYRRDDTALSFSVSDVERLHTLKLEVNGIELASTEEVQLTLDSLQSPFALGDVSLTVKESSREVALAQLENFEVIDPYKPLEVGEHDLTLIAIDHEGKVFRRQETFRVTDEPPRQNDALPMADFIYETSEEDPHLVVLDASPSWDDGGELTYHWQFGDGSTGTGQTLSQRFADHGDREVELMVIDRYGQSDVRRLDIEIPWLSSEATQLGQQGSDTMQFYAEIKTSWDMELSSKGLLVKSGIVETAQRIEGHHRLSHCDHLMVDATTSDAVLMLPLAEHAGGRRYRIHREGEGAVLIRSSFHNKINGVSSWMMAQDYGSGSQQIEIVSDGEHWWTNGSSQEVIPFGASQIFNTSSLIPLKISSGVTAIEGSLDDRLPAVGSGNLSSIHLVPNGESWKLSHEHERLWEAEDAAMVIEVNTALEPGQRFELRCHAQGSDFPIWIDWGDGSQEVWTGKEVNAGDRAFVVHEFPSHADRYFIRLTPMKPMQRIHFDFRWGSLGRILTKVKHWGHFLHTSLEESFMYCDHMDVTAKDPLRVMGESALSAFYACSSMTLAPYMVMPNLRNMNKTFSACSNLLVMPEVDTSVVTSFHETWRGCENLLDFPVMDMRLMQSTTRVFDGVQLPGDRWDQILIHMAGGLGTPQGNRDLDGGRSVLRTQAGKMAKQMIRAKGWNVLDATP
jgi:predicted esterase